MDDAFDFGFNIVSEEELKKYEQELSQQLEETKVVASSALEGLKAMYKPLLENLKKDPGKQYIFWPNRTSIIEQFEKKVDEYIKKNSIT
jgi:hypothetical protein